MAILDVDRLLEPVSDESPCGPNLEYDDTYAAFESAIRGKPSTQFAEDGEPPDWPKAFRLGAELVERTKDLRVVCQLAGVFLQTKGTTGLIDFASCVALVRGYIERYWPTVHPQLDPDDANDPTMRINTIASLSNQGSTIRPLRAAPIVALLGFGTFSLRDWEIAKGEIEPQAGMEPPKMETIEAAFAEFPLDELRANADAVRQSLEHVEAIDSSVTEQVGAGSAVSLDDLRDTLSELLHLLATNLAIRDPSVVVEDANGQPAAAGPGQPAARASGEIRSREDVVAALDRICQYYNRYEPSSPLPLLLGRAKRLASKSFLEIIKDLTPDVVSQIKKLGGESEDEASY